MCDVPVSCVRPIRNADAMWTTTTHGADHPDHACGHGSQNGSPRFDPWRPSDPVQKSPSLTGAESWPPTVISSVPPTVSRTICLRPQSGGWPA